MSYIYLTGLTGNTLDNRIVAFCKHEHNDGRTVLFFDGHVKWYEEKDFKELIKLKLNDSKLKDQYSEQAVNIMEDIVKE